MTVRPLSALLLLVLATAAEACSVPVFAYALRRWVPDVHTLTTAHDGPWRQAMEQQIETAALNLAVEAGSGEDCFGHPARSAPWWSGTLDARRLATLIASPKRRELVRRLASGESAVWLFIPGGDAAADTAARDLLAKRLAYLTTVTALPAVENEDAASDDIMTSAGPAVRLAFSILDLGRDDEAEWVLAAQVRSMARSAAGPWAVPVFGRARALTLLTGTSLTDAAIDEIVTFLTGACSCQVKDQNPGWDLLVACDWREELYAAAAAAPAPVATRAQVMPETVVIRPGEVAIAAEQESDRTWIWLLAGALATAGLVLAVRARR
jgi:hypothetical protein